MKDLDKYVGKCYKHKESDAFIKIAKKLEYPERGYDFTSLTILIFYDEITVTSLDFSLKDINKGYKKITLEEFNQAIEEAKDKIDELIKGKER